MNPIYILLILALALSGCAKSAAPTEPPSPPPTQINTKTRVPTVTATPKPTHTLRPTATPTRTPTRTSTPTKTSTPQPVSMIYLSNTPVSDWDPATRRGYIPRTLKELVLLVQARKGGAELLTELVMEDFGIHVNLGDDLASRVTAIYTGKFREMSPISATTTWFWLTTGTPQMDAEEGKEFFTTEGLFTEGESEYWLPIQASLVEKLKTDGEKGQPVLLYLTFGGYHLLEGKTTWIFPVNAFLFPKEITENPEFAPIFCESEIDEAAAAYIQANDLRDQGKFAEAEELYRKAIELDPGFCDAMDNLAVMLRRQNRVEEAIEWYQRSLEVKPDNTLALNNLGVAYKKQEKYEQAIQVYKKLKQIAPEDPEGYFGLGTSYYLIKQLDEAISDLEIAELLYLQSGSPYIFDAQYYLGLSHFMRDDCIRSRGYLNPIYDHGPDDVRINVYLGICYLNEEPKDLELAKKYLLKAEALGFELTDDQVATLVKVYGAWPPK